MVGDDVLGLLDGLVSAFNFIRDFFNLGDFVFNLSISAVVTCISRNLFKLIESLLSIGLLGDL